MITLYNGNATNWQWEENGKCLMKSINICRRNHLVLAFRIKYFPYSDTVKPVCNDHLYNKTNYLWFIQ